MLPDGSRGPLGLRLGGVLEVALAPVVLGIPAVLAAVEPWNIGRLAPVASAHIAESSNQIGNI